MREDPGNGISPDTETLMLLRQAGIERDELGERLARHEFAALDRELANSTTFDIHIDLEPEDQADSAPVHPETRLRSDLIIGLPSLPVPLGRIAWVKRPEELPVAGILIPDMTSQNLCDALRPLLTEHHRHPFARLLFLCHSLRPVHVLGRYGFSCIFMADTPVADLGPALQAKFGMGQVRDLVSGQKVWTGN